ncbi:RNA polymerase sigma factor [Tahibacter caeni]|uniref:RNA polymerase sigma factor n=1 Tax=Tahibacter caeni TaxID=1453545 RepID=UPI0021481FE2|nr:sigma-70 family RNA polymerase sigma factor [Tahibacter caeni]
MNPDRVLVEAVLARRAGAFERLVADHQGLCWHIIQRLVRHPEDTRELCQETFLRVHQYLHQYRYESALKSWIGRVAYAVALRHLEKRRVPLEETGRDDADEDPLLQESDGFDLESAWADAQLREQLQAAIEALAPLPRMLLTLYHLDELSIPEIVQISGLPAGTIKSHLFRSRLRLRELLQTRFGVSA